MEMRDAVSDDVDTAAEAGVAIGLNAIGLNAIGLNAIDEGGAEGDDGEDDNEGDMMDDEAGETDIAEEAAAVATLGTVEELLGSDVVGNDADDTAGAGLVAAFETTEEVLERDGCKAFENDDVGVADEGGERGIRF